MSETDVNIKSWPGGSFEAIGKLVPESTYVDEHVERFLPLTVVPSAMDTIIVRKDYMIYSYVYVIPKKSSYTTQHKFLWWEWERTTEYDDKEYHSIETWGDTIQVGDTVYITRIEEER